MINPYDLVLLGIGGLLTAYVLLVVGVGAVPHVRRAGAQLRSTFTAPLTTKLDEFDREDRLSRLAAEIRRALGSDGSAGRQDHHDIINAALMAQEITVINQRLRKTVGQCLKMHWAVAQGLAVVEMSEAARHPLCNGLRQRVIDLSDLLSQRLEQYPLLLDAPDLVRLQLGLRWIPGMCATCPYWTCNVADAPRICPTGHAMGDVHRSTSTSPHSAVVDAEVVGPSEDPR